MSIISLFLTSLKTTRPFLDIAKKEERKGNGKNSSRKVFKKGIHFKAIFCILFFSPSLFLKSKQRNKWEREKSGLMVLKNETIVSIVRKQHLC